MNIRSVHCTPINMFSAQSARFQLYLSRKCEQKADLFGKLYILHTKAHTLYNFINLIFLARNNIIWQTFITPNISNVLSSLNGWTIFHLLSAASHVYPERQSSGGYSWGNNVLVWGSRSPCRQRKGGYDMSHRQLWDVSCSTLGPLVCCLSSRFVSTLSNPNKRPQWVTLTD